MYIDRNFKFLYQIKMLFSAYKTWINTKNVYDLLFIRQVLLFSMILLQKKIIKLKMKHMYKTKFKFFRL